MSSAIPKNGGQPPKNGGQPKELVQVQDLVVHYPVRSGVFRRISAWIKAVDGVSFAVREGETLGLVGESGCGKSTVGRAMLRRKEPSSGSVLFNGVDILKLPANQLKPIRRDMQIVFQDPYSSLNPRKPVAEAILAGGSGDADPAGKGAGEREAGRVR